MLYFEPQANSTIYIPFDTIAEGSGSITISGLATSDIEIYKNGSATTRASDSGYTLLDTDGIDFAGTTGLHAISIDLSDNTDAGFFEVGATYMVAIASITVDSQTVNAWVAVFRIRPAETVTGYAVVDAAAISGDATAADNLELMFDNTGYNASNSTIGTVSTLTGHTVQTGDTYALAAGANGFAAIVTDLDDVKGTAFVKDTHSLTNIEGYADLIDDGTSGLAKIATDVAAILVDTATTIPGVLGTPIDFGSGTSTLAANLQDIADNGTATFDRSTDSLQALRDHVGDGTNLTEAGGTGDHLTAINVATITAGAITAAAIATDAIDADALAADAGTEIGTAVWATAARTLTAATNITSTGGSVPITAGGYVSADVTAISTDTGAADNLELMYDGTGYTDGTAPASRDQVDAIGAGSGGSVNIEATEDNTGGAIDPSSAAFVGTVTGGTFASTEAEDGTVHSIDDTANDIDVVYGFSVGAGRSATNVTFKGYLQGVGDEMKIKAYDHVGADWEIIGTITGAAGTTVVTIEAALLLKHTGTGAEAGKVYIRLETDSTTPATLATDQLIVSAVTNEAGIANGSTVTLSAAATNGNYIGRNWNLALGGQSVTGIYVEGATVSGTGTGSSTTWVDCTIAAAASIPAGTYIRCAFAGTSGSPVTESGTGQYIFIDCVSAVAGSGAPYFNFSGAGGTVGINNRRWAGGVDWTLDSNCTLSHEVLAGGGTTITTGGGNAEIRGVCRALTVTMSGTETVQFVGITGPITLSGTTTATVNLHGVSTSLSDSTSAATVTDNTVRGPDTAAILVDTNELQGDWTNGGRLDLLIDNIGADTDAILTDTADMQPKLGSPAGASMSADIAAIKVDTAATLVDTAEIGTAGAGLTDLGGMSTTMKAQINTEVVDTLNTDTYAEPGQGAPGATISLAAKIGYLYKAWRNKATATSTAYTLYADDTTTADQASTNSDDGTTFTKGEIGTGA